MYNKETENKILGNLLRTPIISKSLHQISVETGLSYVTVHKLVPYLLKKKVISQEKKGKANLISIDFENAEVEDLSSAILYEKKKFMRKYTKIALLKNNVENALATKYYIMMIFGSYSKEKVRKGSDIDLLFIIPKTENPEFYKKNLEKAFKLSTLDIDYKVISEKDFIDMLKQKHTVGREVFESGLVLFGAEHYYSMVKKNV